MLNVIVYVCIFVFQCTIQVSATVNTRRILYSCFNFKEGSLFVFIIWMVGPQRQFLCRRYNYPQFCSSSKLWFNLLFYLSTDSTSSSNVRPPRPLVSLVDLFFQLSKPPTIIRSMSIYLGLPLVFIPCIFLSITVLFISTLPVLLIVFNGLSMNLQASSVYRPSFPFTCWTQIRLINALSIN